MSAGCHPSIMTFARCKPCHCHLTSHTTAPSTSCPAHLPSRFNCLVLKERPWRPYIKNSLAAGIIHRRPLLVLASSLSKRKSLRPCNNYRGLSDITIKIATLCLTSPPPLICSKVPPSSPSLIFATPIIWSASGRGTNGKLPSTHPQATTNTW